MRLLSSFFSYGRGLGLFCVVNGPSVACGTRSVATALALLFSVEGNMVLFVGKGVVVVVVCSANVKKKKKKSSFGHLYFYTLSFGLEERISNLPMDVL